MPKQKRPNKAKPAVADMTTAEATVATLIAHGLDTVYALPGVHNDHLFDAFQRAGDRIRVVHTRHEQGAAYMALGAALATGKPQAYAVVPGPGLLNSGAALLTAYGMNAPVLALIGQIPHAAIGRGLGHLHEIRDQAGIIARLVDHSARIDGPGEAPRKSRQGDPRDAAGPARPGRARMRHRCLGQARAGCGDRAARAAARAAHRRGRGAQGRQAARQGQARADRRRRRRAGCLARGDAALEHAAGAGARLPARPRRARRPQSVQRHAAARPRPVGRGRRGARGRHAAARSADAYGASTTTCRSCASMPTRRSLRGCASRTSR